MNRPAIWGRDTVQIDPAACLEPTDFIDAKHPSIQAVIEELKVDDLPQPEAAAALFFYVRDEISYEFMLKLSRDEYVASNILQEKKGFCVQKAVLLAALGRGAGIPTVLMISDLRDHSMQPDLEEALRSNTLFHHGFNALFLEGRWLLVDASLSIDVVRRKGYRPVEFNGREDALMSSTTLSGAPHNEYTKLYGAFADLDYDEMIDTFAEGYRNADIAAVQRALKKKW